MSIDTWWAAAPVGAAWGVWRAASGRTARVGIRLAAVLRLQRRGVPSDEIARLLLAADDRDATTR